MPKPLLQEVAPTVDENLVGISYSGGGPMFLIELGIAQAFVDLNIIPAAIAGVSAGAIAGTAHAFDPVKGDGIKAAAKALLMLSNRRLGLTKWRMALRVLASLLSRRQLPDSLADNGPLQPIIEGVFRELAQEPGLTLGDFGKDGRPALFIGATDRLTGERCWFPNSVQVADALVASSAIPGVFPPHRMNVDGQDRVFVDGAVVQNQPLSQLVLEANCGTLYACAVGYDGDRLAAPTDALDNVLKCVVINAHAFSRLEQGYVELKFQAAGKGAVHHLHPEGPFEVNDFNFTPDLIQSVMSTACEQTKSAIHEYHWMPPVPALAGAVPVAVTSGPAPGSGAAPM